MIHCPASDHMFHQRSFHNECIPPKFLPKRDRHRTLQRTSNEIRIPLRSSFLLIPHDLLRIPETLPLGTTPLRSTCTILKLCKAIERSFYRLGLIWAIWIGAPKYALPLREGARICNTERYESTRLANILAIERDATPYQPTDDKERISYQLFDRLLLGIRLMRVFLDLLLALPLHQWIWQLIGKYWGNW